MTRSKHSAAWQRGLIVLAIATFTSANATSVLALDYFNGFETDASGWQLFGGGSNFDAVRVMSGTDGIASASGSWHAESDTAVGDWGGYTDAFPPNGYATSVDIYLDVDGLWNNDMRFDFDSSIGMPNPPDDTLRRDFIFNAGFYNDDDGSPGSGLKRFIVSASNDMQTDQQALAKDHDPVAILSTGWYTFQHRFYDSGGGVLAVDMTITDSSGVLVHSWTLSDPSDIIGSTVGGNHYGWFDHNDFPVLAFDNTRKVDVVVSDTDGDGVPDDTDACPDSDLSATVTIDGCDSGVTNTLFPTGCTIADLVNQCAAGAHDHGQFVSCVAHRSNDLTPDGSISGKGKGAIQKCSAKANVP